MRTRSPLEFGNTRMKHAQLHHFQICAILFECHHPKLYVSYARMRLLYHEAHEEGKPPVPTWIRLLTEPRCLETDARIGRPSLSTDRERKGAHRGNLPDYMLRPFSLCSPRCVRDVSDYAACQLDELRLPGLRLSQPIPKSLRRADPTTPGICELSAQRDYLFLTLFFF